MSPIAGILILIGVLLALALTLPWGIKYYMRYVNWITEEDKWKY